MLQKQEEVCNCEVEMCVTNMSKILQVYMTWHRAGYVVLFEPIASNHASIQVQTTGLFIQKKRQPRYIAFFMVLLTCGFLGSLVLFSFALGSFFGISSLQIYTGRFCFFFSSHASLSLFLKGFQTLHLFLSDLLCSLSAFWDLHNSKCCWVWMLALFFDTL